MNYYLVINQLLSSNFFYQNHNESEHMHLELEKLFLSQQNIILQWSVATYLQQYSLRCLCVLRKLKPINFQEFNHPIKPIWFFSGKV